MEFSEKLHEQFALDAGGSRIDKIQNDALD